MACEREQRGYSPRGDARDIELEVMTDDAGRRYTLLILLPSFQIVHSTHLANKCKGVGVRLKMYPNPRT